MVEGVPFFCRVTLSLTLGWVTMQRSLFCKFVAARVPFCVALLFSLVWSRLRSGIDLTFIGLLLLKGGPCQLLALGFQLPCALSGHLDPSAFALLGRGLIGRTAQTSANDHRRRRICVQARRHLWARTNSDALVLKRMWPHLSSTHARFAFCMCRRLFVVCTHIWRVVLRHGPCLPGLACVVILVIVFAA